MGSLGDQRGLHSDNHSLDDLSAIQNLLLDESFEDVHSSISRRDQIRNALASRASSVMKQLSPFTADNRKVNGDNAESRLLQIILSQTEGGGGGSHHSPGAVGGPPISPLSRKRSTSSRRRIVEGSGALDRKLGSKRNSSTPTIVVVRDDGDDRSTGTSGNNSRHSSRQRRTGTKRDDGTDIRRGDRRSVTSEGRSGRSKSKNRSSSPRRSSSTVSRRSSHQRRSSIVSTSSRRRRSDSLGPRREAALSDDDLTEASDRRSKHRTGKDRQGRKESSRSSRRSSSLRPDKGLNNRLKSSNLNSLDDLNKSLNDLGVSGLYAEQHPNMCRQLSVPSMENDPKSRSDRRGGGRSLRRSSSAERQDSDQAAKTFGDDSKSMLETALDNFMVDITAESAHTGAAESITTGASSHHSQSYLSNASMGTGSPGTKARKTKLEKIHELQAKCDRYKKEWSDASQDKRYYRKELDASKLLLVSLTKQLDTNMLETSILQKNLSETLQQLESTREEQREERSEMSNTAKELAQARIDHAKSVNDCRELQAQLDRIQIEMNEKDRQIQSLQEELTSAKGTVDNLEADLLYADEQISKLEDDIKRIEEEVLMYRDVANKENGEHDCEKLREARDEMELRMLEEKEKRLEEKQRKLEEKIKLFEEEKGRHLEQQAKKEQEYMDLLAEEGEKLKSRDGNRQKLDDEINERLRELGEDNIALQGRLKSEQLDSAAKLKKKDQALEQLQQEIAKMKEEARSTGVEQLREEIEIIKTTAGTTQAELEDALKQNKMFQEEVTELRTVNNEMKTWVVTLEDVTIDQKKIIDYEKGRMEDWRKKAGEWSTQTHKWKEKADMWEKKAKSLDPDVTTDDLVSDSVDGDPQALFLAAALEKKKAADSAGSSRGGSAWKFGGIFHKSSAEVADEAQSRIEELEIENTKQGVEIKTLKSELVQMKTTYTEDIYAKEQECEQLRKDNETLEVKSTNLSKELELARRLNQSMDAGEES
jgi:hypothetical protein